MDVTVTESVVRIPRRQFFEEWAKFPKKNRNENLVRYVITLVDASPEDVVVIEPLKDSVAHVSNKISERWEKCHRKLQVFSSKYSSWLDKDDLEFNISRQNIQQTSQRTGRPEKNFLDSSEKTKKRKIHDLLAVECEKLSYATQLSLYSSGNRSAAKVVKKATTSQQPSSAKRKSTPTNVRCLSPDEALALFIDCKLTKASYCLLRQRAKEVGHDLYPSYYRVQQAKKSCIPEERVITESRAELPLQALLNRTAQRLCEVQHPVLKQLVDRGAYDFTLFSKWGCDGSGGQSKYHQKFSSDSGNDENIFMFSLVPICLQPMNGQSYVWQNSVPGSTRFCRPIKFMFQKETASLIVSETDLVKEQIRELSPTKVNVDGKEISISHNLALTMLDGKACNALTDTKSTQTCYICKATPKIFNDRNCTLPLDNTENYSFGLATLHGWIRTFEFLLNIAYRLTLKERRKTVKTEEDRQDFALQKANIQKKFKDQLGLNVDQPKQGFGNTNDGNMARRFFLNSAVSASITGLDETLINRFRVILQTLSSGYEIDVQNFNEYTSETTRLYLDLYPWYGMTPTIHKILDHSAQIIENQMIPIGQLTEEAQEARNKDFRRFRERCTRKNSRLSTNTDLLSMLLVSSDPVVASFRKPVQKRNGPLDSEVLRLLKCNVPSQKLYLSNISLLDQSQSDYVSSEIYTSASEEETSDID